MGIQAVGSEIASEYTCDAKSDGCTPAVQPFCDIQPQIAEQSVEREAYLVPGVVIVTWLVTEA